MDTNSGQAAPLFRFVDLFAGIGGFHLALGDRYGGLGANACSPASWTGRRGRSTGPTSAVSSRATSERSSLEPGC